MWCRVILTVSLPLYQKQELWLLINCGFGATRMLALSQLYEIFPQHDLGMYFAARVLHIC